MKLSDKIGLRMAFKAAHEHIVAPTVEFIQNTSEFLTAKTATAIAEAMIEGVQNLIAPPQQEQFAPIPVTKRDAPRRKF